MQSQHDRDRAAYTHGAHDRYVLRMADKYLAEHRFLVKLRARRSARNQR
jgi:hypothetical protein